MKHEEELRQWRRKLHTPEAKAVAKAHARAFATHSASDPFAGDRAYSRMILGVETPKDYPIPKKKDSERLAA